VTLPHSAPRVPTRHLFLLVTVAITLAACDHSTPFAITDPDPLGPRTSAVPRRLTYNVGIDRDPSATSAQLVYTQFPIGRSDGDGCLAYLPPVGGTLIDLHCPGGSAADDQQDVWLCGALSSGNEIAYVWEAAAINGIVPDDRTLRIAHAANPDSVLVEKNTFFSLPDGRRAMAVWDLMWDDVGRVRFVAGVDSYSVNFGVWDTTLIAYSLATLDPAVGEFRAVSGTDNAYAHLTAPNDAVWFVTSDAPTTLQLRAVDGSVTAVGAFVRPVTKLTLIDGMPAAMSIAGDTTAIERIDPVTGASDGTFPLLVRARAIAGVPGTRRFVLELESGNGRDLWLYELP
jgi:hypothetical protein